MSAVDLDVEVVGREFVRQYYTVLNQRPDCLHQFFTQDSSFIHGGVEKPGEEQPACQGQAVIHQKILSLNFCDCHTKIRQVDCQQTVGNAVLVQVSGELSNNREPMRRFMQSFVLVQQAPKKFYVHNDIFRYQDEVFHDFIVEQEEQQELNAGVEATNGSQGHSLDGSMVDSQVHEETLSSQEVKSNYGLMENGLVHQHVQIQHLNDTECDDEGDRYQQQQVNQKELEEEVEVCEEVIETSVFSTPPQFESSIAVSHAVATTAEVSQSKADSSEAVKHGNVLDGETTRILENGNHLVVDKNETVGDKLSSNISTVPVVENNASPICVSSNNQTQQAPVPKKFSWASLASKNTGAGSNPSQLMSSGGKPQAAIKPERKSESSTPLLNGGTSNSAMAMAQQQNSPGNKTNENKWSTINETGESTNVVSNGNMGSGGFIKNQNLTPSFIPDNQQLFVGNLPHSVTDGELIELFEKFGSVIDVKINRKGSSRDLPNFGFIAFDSHNAVVQALKARPIMLHGKRRINIEEKKDQSSGGFSRGRPGPRGGVKGGSGPNRPPFARPSPSPQTHTAQQQQTNNMRASSMENE